MARVNGTLGWLTVAISVVIVPVLLVQSNRIFGPGANTVLGIAYLVAALLGAVVPFCIWAGLTALCEIHEQEERTTHALQSLERTLSKLAPPWTTSEMNVENGSLDGPVASIEDTEITFPQVMIATRAVSIYVGDDQPKGDPISYIAVDGKVTVTSRHGKWARVKGSFGREGLVEADALKPLDV